MAAPVAPAPAAAPPANDDTVYYVGGAIVLLVVCAGLAMVLSGKGPLIGLGEADDPGVAWCVTSTPDAPLGAPEDIAAMWNPETGLDRDSFINWLFNQRIASIIGDVNVMKTDAAALVRDLTLAKAKLDKFVPSDTAVRFSSGIGVAGKLKCDGALTTGVQAKGDLAIDGTGVIMSDNGSGALYIRDCNTRTALYTSDGLTNTPNVSSNRFAMKRD